MDETALFKLTHGLYVLGAQDKNNSQRLVGSIVDAVMQVANKPLVIALSCHNRSYTKSCIETNCRFSLSVICKNVNPFVIGNFGFQSSEKVDKWNHVDYILKNDLPYLKENLAMLEARVVQKVVYESNTLFLAELVACSNQNDGVPLTYNDYRDYFKNDVIKAFTQFKQKGE